MSVKIIYENRPLTAEVDGAEVELLRRRHCAAYPEWSTGLASLLGRYPVHWVCTQCNSNDCEHVKTVERAEALKVRWYAWRTNLRRGGIRVTVAAVVGDHPRAAQARYQKGVAARYSLEAPPRALRDGSLYREILRGVKTKAALDSLKSALLRSWVLPLGGER